MQALLTRRRIRLGSYAAMLLALVAYLVVSSVLQEHGRGVTWAKEAVLLVILFATIGSATESRRQLAILIVLAALGLALHAVRLQSDAAWIEIAMGVVRVLFLLLAVAVILRHVFRDATVSPDMILGAVCAYLLVGFVFNQLYTMVEALWPGSFTGPVGVRHDGGYFSLVTLSTLGYGDLVPTRALARSIAAIEAVVGQFYIAVIVARLVAQQVAHAGAGRVAKAGD